MRNTLKNKNIRKIYRKAGSYAVTLPIEIIKELKIKEGQKVVVEKYGKGILIKDWGK
jgi:antitoxin component of MazEF toxin-antitoxin module